MSLSDYSYHYDFNERMETEKATNSAVLIFLIISAYALNILLIVNILTTKRLRTIINFLYCHLIAVNLFDLTFNVMFAFIIVICKETKINNVLCTFNVATQQFANIQTIVALLLIGAERAIGIILGYNYLQKQEKYVNGFKLSLISIALMSCSLILSSLCFLDTIPSTLFASRNLCGINKNGPIGYSITRITVYIICLLISLIIAGIVFKKRYAFPEDYANEERIAHFTHVNRIMSDHKKPAVLMIFLLCVYLILSGPFIVRCFYYEIINSIELSSYNLTDEAKNLDTVMIWLKFLFPLLCPILIFAWLEDIWKRTRNYMSCSCVESTATDYYMTDFTHRTG